MSVFVDTWAWFALTDHSSSDYEIAELTFDDLCEQNTELVTTNFVLAEATTLIRYKVHHAAAVGFRRMIRKLVSDNLLTVVHVMEAQEESAGEIFDRYDTMDLSFTDCTSFVVMRELGLTEAFSGDHHFQACRLYPSDAADDPRCVDLGGRRIIKKKNSRYSSRKSLPLVPPLSSLGCLQ